MRALDVSVGLLGLVLLAPLMTLVAVSCWLDTSSPLLRQQRIGWRKRPFVLVKFRTMRLGTPNVASHLADASRISPLGALLRRTKIDELPQLWNVVKGDMSLVGPRPCLPNQAEVIAARERLGVFAARPGITGLSQLSGIDMSTPQLLAETDAHMIRSLTLTRYFSYLLRTITGSGTGDAVSRKK